jgi:hypothetical protein
MCRMIGTGSELRQPAATESDFPIRPLYLMDTVRGPGAIKDQILRWSSRVLEGE